MSDSCADPQVLLVWEVAREQGEERIGKVGLHARGEQNNKDTSSSQANSPDPCSRKHGQRKGQ